LSEPKCIVGFSDITALQVFVWQVRQWVSFGTQAAAGFAAGSGNRAATTNLPFFKRCGTRREAGTLLGGMALAEGSAEGRVLAVA
jgi:muramoyltetrapeptide carboxypeptidase LdcA involved in peptidoglycan recycling